jgi:hypothetical protein
VSDKDGTPNDKELEELRVTRRTREPPSDAQIEAALRERAVSDPRAAEIPLRWLQRARPPEGLQVWISTRCRRHSWSVCMRAW